MVFREDRQRTRLDNRPLNLATARKLALQALHQVQDANSTTNRRKMAGWEDEYLRAVLTKRLRKQTGLEEGLLTK